MGLPLVNNFIGSGRTGQYFNANRGFWSYYAPLLLWGAGDNFTYLAINGTAGNLSDVVIGSGIVGGNMTGNMAICRLLTWEYLNTNLATSDLIKTIFN